MKSKKTTTQKIPTDIVEYAKFRGFELTPDQIDTLRAVIETNRPVICSAAHSVGKSLLAAVLACWFFETHDEAIGLITAPVNRQISEIIFKEMRRILPNNKYFAPKANSLYKNSSHWVNGYATNKPDAFQGKHSAGGILIIFDECSSVDTCFWQRAASMHESGKPKHYWLNIGNPYTKSSPMYLEGLTGKYELKNISALTHPNVVQKKEVIPGAITYDTVKERIKLECRLAEDHELDNSFEFEGIKYISQSYLFDVQIRGNYPSQSAFSLYSEFDLKQLLAQYDDDKSHQIAIGADIARYGSCDTVLVVRRGRNILEAQSFNGLSIVQTASKLRGLCDKYANEHIKAQHIPCYIDGSGLGCGVVDMNQGYNFIEILNNKKAAEDMETYVRGKRTELWVRARDFARNGYISIAKLPKQQQDLLLQELRMPEFSVTENGLMFLESKEKIIDRLGKSPDFADSFALACCVPEQHFESHF